MIMVKPIRQKIIFDTTRKKRIWASLRAWQNSSRVKSYLMYLLFLCRGIPGACKGGVDCKVKRIDYCAENQLVEYVEIEHAENVDYKSKNAENNGGVAVQCVVVERLVR